MSEIKNCRAFFEERVTIISENNIQNYSTPSNREEFSTIFTRNIFVFFLSKSPGI